MGIPSPRGSEPYCTTGTAIVFTNTFLIIDGPMRLLPSEYASATLQRILPPYEEFLPVDRLAHTQPPGTVFGIQAAPDTPGHVLQEGANLTYRKAPTASVVVLANRVAAIPPMALTAAEAGLPLVLIDGSNCAAELRDALTRTGLRRHEFRRWLRTTLRADERLINLFGLLIEEAVLTYDSERRFERVDAPGRTCSVPSMAAIVGMAKRGLRAAFARAGLASPVQWRGFARALVQAVIVQRDTLESLTRLAFMLGHASLEGLSRLTRRYFDVTRRSFASAWVGGGSPIAGSIE
jgi:AraC-like DNA-binding protein